MLSIDFFSGANGEFMHAMRATSSHLRVIYGLEKFIFLHSLLLPVTADVLILIRAYTRISSLAFPLLYSVVFSDLSDE